MFCTNCGNKLNDDALFCTNCGARVREAQISPERETSLDENAYMMQETSSDENAYMPQETISDENAYMPQETISDENPYMPNETPPDESAHMKSETPPEEHTHMINETPPDENTHTTNETSPSPYAHMQYIRPTGGNAFIQYGEPAQTKPEASKTQRRTIVPLAVLSLVFAILTIGCAVIEMLDDTSGIRDIARLIEVMTASIIIIIFAFLNNATVFVLKGIALSILLISDIIFIGFDSVKTAFDSLNNSVTVLALLKDVSENLLTSYFVTVIVWFIAMYILFIMDAVRSFAGAVGAKTITIFFGIVAFAGIIMQMIFKVIIDGEMVMFMGFLPFNAIYAFLMLAIIFSIAAKKKAPKEKIS